MSVKNFCFNIFFCLDIWHVFCVTKPSILSRIINKINLYFRVKGEISTLKMIDNYYLSFHLDPSKAVGIPQ